MLAYIKEHPGLSHDELHNALGDAVSDLIGKLKSKDLIESHKLDRTRYYPFGTRAANSLNANQTRLVENYGQRRNQVLALVTQQPGITRRAINEALGRAPDSTDLSIARWVKMGLLEVRTTGVINHYYPPGYSFDGTEGNIVPESDPHPAHGGKRATLDIEALAKTFVWETGSTNLKEFINWYKERR